MIQLRTRLSKRQATPAAHDDAAEAHARIMVEQMVRDGKSERAIDAAVRRAAPDLR
jgi:hypothetical protein